MILFGFLLLVLCGLIVAVLVGLASGLKDQFLKENKQTNRFK